MQMQLDRNTTFECERGVWRPGPGRAKRGGDVDTRQSWRYLATVRGSYRRIIVGRANALPGINLELSFD